MVSKNYTMSTVYTLMASGSSIAAGTGMASVAGCGSSQRGEHEQDWAAARMCLDRLKALNFCRTDVHVNTKLPPNYFHVVLEIVNTSSVSSTRLIKLSSRDQVLF